MKIEKRIFVIAVSIILVITIAIVVMLNVTNDRIKLNKDEIESSAIGYVDALEKYADASNYSNDIASINNGAYTVKELTKLGLKYKGTLPDETSILTLDLYGKVMEAWFTYGDYKVYYSMVNKKAIVSTTGDFLDEYGTNHNQIRIPDSFKK